MCLSLRWLTSNNIKFYESCNVKLKWTILFNKSQAGYNLCITMWPTYNRRNYMRKLVRSPKIRLQLVEVKTIVDHDRKRWEGYYGGACGDLHNLIIPWNLKPIWVPIYTYQDNWTYLEENEMWILKESNAPFT